MTLSSTSFPLQGAQLLTAAKGLSNLKVNLTHLHSCHFCNGSYCCTVNEACTWSIKVGRLWVSSSLRRSGD